jgi:hypothetical protein
MRAVTIEENRQDSCVAEGIVARRSLSLRSHALERMQPAVNHHGLCYVFVAKSSVSAEREW